MIQAGVSIVLLGLLVWLIQQLVTSKTNEGISKNQIKTNEDEIDNLKYEIDKKNREINNLNESLKQYTEKDRILAKYKFVESLGIHQEIASKHYFCSRCLINQTKESPLQTEVDGWRCKACDSYIPKEN